MAGRSGCGCGELEVDPTVAGDEPRLDLNLRMIFDCGLVGLDLDCFLCFQSAIKTPFALHFGSQVGEYFSPVLLSSSQSMRYFLAVSLRMLLARQTVSSEESRSGDLCRLAGLLRASVVSLSCFRFFDSTRGAITRARVWKFDVGRCVGKPW